MAIYSKGSASFWGELFLAEAFLNDMLRHTVKRVPNKPCDWLKQMALSVSTNRMVCLVHISRYVEAPYWIVYCVYSMATHNLFLVLRIDVVTFSEI